MCCLRKDINRLVLLNGWQEGRAMVLTPHMKQVGVSHKLLKTTKRLECPRCGREFSLFQSRAIACKGCKFATTSCKFARCPHCDYEFPLSSLWVDSKEKEKVLSNYMNAVIKNYHDSVGQKPSR
jgi:DNA-directed RNA polymerase subunit RPC12/RpoP